ncbi:MAG: hypothetical protein WC435_03725 [Candidatus Paceibacterota bacterium]
MKALNEYLHSLSLPLIVFMFFLLFLDYLNIIDLNPHSSTSTFAPAPVYTLADNLYNVESYVIDNETGNPVPDGIFWDYAVLINPRVSGELVEIPSELLSKKSNSRRSHFFFLDALKKASKVYKLRKKEEIKEALWATNGIDIRKTDNFLDIKFCVNNDNFFIIDPEIKGNGGDKVCIPEFFASHTSPKVWENESYFFYRYQLELISW